MSWWNWQGRLLPYAIRYGLLKSGFLDAETAKDLANFDISLGSKRSVVELKNLGLDVRRIGEVAQLPPSLQLKTARLLSLRLIFVREGYQPNVELEIDGIEVVVCSADHNGETTSASGPGRGPKHHTSDEIPRSPLPYDPGGTIFSKTDAHLPTTQEMARSFLKDESLVQRKEMETSIVEDMKDIEESFMSDTEYDDGDVGTGVAGGLPIFLSKILEGVLERVKYRIVNLRIRLEAEIGTDNIDRCPIALQLRVGEVHGTGILGADVAAYNFTLDLIARDAIMIGLASVSRQTSPTLSRAPTHMPVNEEHNSAMLTVAPVHYDESSSIHTEGSMMSTNEHAGVVDDLPVLHEASSNPSTLNDSQMQFPDETIESSIEIQAGDDNESWRSRRIRADGLADDLWSSMLSADDAQLSPTQGYDQFYGLDDSHKFHNRWNDAHDQDRNRLNTRVPTNMQSWPGPSQDGVKPRLQKSLKSWPNLDDEIQVTDRIDRDAHKVGRDGLRNQLRFSQSPALSDSQRPPSPEVESETHENNDDDESADDQDNDEMLESRYYTHEEAESIYLSAVMEKTTADVPGAWHTDDSDTDISLHERAHERNLATPEYEIRETAESVASESTPVASVCETPRATSPNFAPALSESARKLQESSFQLLSIDKVLVVYHRQPEIASSPTDTIPIPDNAKAKTQGLNREMPGAFSAYSDLSRSRQSLASSLYSMPERKTEPPKTFSGLESILSTLSVGIGTMNLRVDIPSSRVLYNLCTKVVADFPDNQSSSSSETKEPGINAQSTNAITVRVGLERLAVSLCDRLRPQLQRTGAGPSADSLASLICEQIHFTKTEDTSLQIKAFKILLGDRDFLSLRHDIIPMTASRKLSADDCILDLVVSEHRGGINNKSITDVQLETASLMLHLDLVTVDDIFGSFGGLSGILEFGGSILGDSMSSAPTIKPSQTKGVRFATKVDKIESVSHEIKFNGRINGINATLQTMRCSLTLRTTALKVIHRHYGTSVSLSHIMIEGPFNESFLEAPICADISGLRLEFQNSPQDKDLERLLSLLTPSKDKYDNDNDILIDTLLRQRRKGAVLKVVVSDTKLKLSSWSCIPVLTTLGEDFSRLSAVAKYLPEDERPGMLALVCLRTTEVRLPVNQDFGLLRVVLQDAHLAHVGLPALLALAIGKIQASPVGGPDLIHTLVLYPAFENLPVLMARLLGDEEEPTLKIKFFNLAVEYSVPMLRGLIGSESIPEAEQLIINMAESIASLSMTNTPRKPVNRSTTTSEFSAASQKKMRLDMQIHDSAIGLTPQKLTSKVYFVLNDTHISTIVPPGDVFKVTLRLKKASLYMTDIVIEQPPSSASEQSPHTLQSIEWLLLSQGYIPIGSVMKAVVMVQVADDHLDSEQKNVEVDLKTELFLLETCADSTATLFATLGDLAPPSAPSKDAKYLTQPITIEDMMASFTGEPYAEPVALPETLFDVDDDISADSDLLYDVAGLDVESQHLFEESEMTSSLYGPIGDVFDHDDRDNLGNDSTVSHDHLDTVASLLEDDPFEMPDIPEDIMSDTHLLRALDKQQFACVDDKTVSLLQEDAEKPHPTNITTKNSNVPLKVRVRDTHLIWQLYDGYDWQRTRDDIELTVEQVELKAEERKTRGRESHNHVDDDESVIGDFLFNSIYIGVTAGHENQDLRRAINKAINDQATETESVAVSGTSRPTNYSSSGQPRLAPRRSRLKLGRSRKNKIAFELRNVAADVKAFAPGSGDVVNTVSLRIGDFEIFDRVPTSTWRKFLTHIDNSPRTREVARPMFDVDIQSVKTLQSHSASEMLLHVSVLPLRLHVDQDALDFINRFFDFKDARLTSNDPPSEEPFIQRLEIDTVDLRLDYKPKQLDYVGLRAGRTSELKNIVTLEGANIQLKHLIVYGLRGFDKIHPTLNDIWVEDVIRNQLPVVLSGIAAMRSLVNIGTGFRDVVAIPVREYRKDGRIVRSIQKGSYTFGKTTASELARLGAKVALGTQTVLTTAEQYLSPAIGSSSRPSTIRRVSSDGGVHEISAGEDESEQRLVSAYANQPLGVLAGLQTARRQLEYDLLTAKDALIAVQGEMMDSRSPGDAIAAVARHAPTLLLRPVIGATRAVGTTLLGVGNQIDRSNMRQIEDVSSFNDVCFPNSSLTCANRNTSRIR
jgi:autophagy-related protein 2